MCVFEKDGRTRKHAHAHTRTQWLGAGRRHFVIANDFMSETLRAALFAKLSPAEHIVFAGMENGDLKCLNNAARSLGACFGLGYSTNEAALLQNKLVERLSRGESLATGLSREGVPAGWADAAEHDSNKSLTWP